jgi:hypothetical protein
VNQNYLLDKNQQQILVHNISSRLESLAVACLDLTDTRNSDKVQSCFYYLWGKNGENSQLRGIQHEYMAAIFRDITLASNLDFSKVTLDLSAKNLGCSPGLNLQLLEYVPCAEYPAEFEVVNSNSVLNALEVTPGMIHSSMTGQKVIFTNDKPLSLKNNTKPIIDNMPKGQKNPDIYRVSPFSLIKEDFKETTLEKLAQSKLNPGITTVGFVDLASEKKVVSDIAAKGRKNLNKISNVDPNNNSQNVAILNKMEATGEIKDGRDLLGIQRLYSNRFLDSPDD